MIWWIDFKMRHQMHVCHDYDMMHVLDDGQTCGMNVCLCVSERLSRALRRSSPLDPLWCLSLRERRPEGEKALSLMQLNAPQTPQTAQLIQFRYIELVEQVEIHIQHVLFFFSI